MPSTLVRLAVLASLALASRAEAEEALEFQAPDGFVVLVRRGMVTPEAARAPAFSSLAGTPGIEFMAARLGDDGQPMGTFQVLIKSRPSTFDDTTIERFAEELAGELKEGGLPPQVTRKDIVTVAGRPAGRVVAISKLRRMLFLGVPLGQRTALMLYAASERDFPPLYPSFERSVAATRRITVAGPPSPPATGPAPAGAGTPATSPGSGGDTPWLATIAGALVLGLVVFALTSRRRAPAAPAQKKSRRS